MRRLTQGLLLMLTILAGLGCLFASAQLSFAFDPYLAVPPGIWATGLRLDNGLYADDAAISDTRSGTRVSATIRARHTITGQYGVGLPYQSVIANRSPGGIVWSYYGEARLELGSDTHSWAITQELSVVNTVRDFGYQRGCPGGFDPGRAECVWWGWDSPILSALRLTSGNGSAFGCAYGRNCFDTGFALEIYPNGSRFHTGVVFGPGATIDRDLSTFSDADVAYEVAGRHRVGIDLSQGTFAEAAIKLPPPGNVRALCVTPQGQVFVSTTTRC